MTGDQQPTNPTTLEQRLNVDFALQAAGLGIWEYDPVANQVLWDQRCRALFGLTANNRMSYEEAFQHVHPDDVSRVDQAAQKVMNPQSDGVFDQTYRTIGVDDGKLRWVRFQGQVDFTAGGKVQRFAGIAQEVTQQVLARQQLEESELFARTLFEYSPVAKAVFVGQEMTIRTANKNMLSMWGKESSVIGRPFMEAVPELTGTPQIDRLRQVLATGERFYQAEEKFELLRYGQPYTGYYEYTYEALRTASGMIYGVICVANEVTTQAQARLEVAEQKTYRTPSTLLTSVHSPLM